MTARQILLTPIITEAICKNLTFEEAINYRDALELPSLKCSFPVQDKTGQVYISPVVNDETVAAYFEIKQSNFALAMINAIDQRNLKVIKGLLLMGFKINDSKNPPYLPFASWRGYLDVVKILLKVGVNVNSRDRDEKTGLISASAGGYTKIVQTLLEYGAEINDMDRYANTALRLAIEKNHPEIVKILLKAGADFGKDDFHGKTALMTAASSGHLEIVKILLDSEARNTINFKDNYGNTALSLAIENGYPKIVALLK